MNDEMRSNFNSSLQTDNYDEIKGLVDQLNGEDIQEEFPNEKEFITILW